VVVASASFPWAATTGDRIIGSVAQWRHRFMWLSGSCGMRSSDEVDEVSTPSELTTAIAVTISNLSGSLQQLQPQQQQQLQQQQQQQQQQRLRPNKVTTSIKQGI
jgi:hypothetical protein